MNVILIILDSLRKDHVGVYGNEWIKTPHLDKLAKNSIIFDNAYPETLPTIPARRAIHTGMRCFPFKSYKPRRGDIVKALGWEPIPDEQDTIAEVLFKRKFKTIFITDTYHQFKPSMNFHRGFSEWHWIRGQEGDNYRSLPKIRKKDMKRYLPKSGISEHIALILSEYLKNIVKRKKEEDYFAPRVFSRAIKWLEENQDVHKFFLCIDSFDPHEPWDPPEKYRDLYYPNYQGRKIITPNYLENANYLTSEELKYMRACYSAEVTMVDTWFGKLMAKVEDLGVIDNSIIMCISDHGHQLGEVHNNGKHRMTGKIPWGLYPELVDIPFFIRHPNGIGKGKRIKSFVYNHDIFPTIMAALNVEYKNPVNGKNLWPLIDNDFFEDRTYITCGFNSYVLARDENFAYITDYKQKNEYLYDLKKDPLQENNIVYKDKETKDKMFNKILLDADGELIDHSNVLIKKIEQWYRMSF
ncbi:MAG: sulfatase [Candidatus Helarchaeota archaeon]